MDTFTLTGKILDKSTAPVAGARLVLSGNPAVLRDPDTDEVYAPPPRIATDADGNLCVADAAGVPSDTPGIPLVVGVQYTLRGVSPSLIGRLVFSAPEAGATLDVADIIPEPPETPPTFEDIMLQLAADFDAAQITEEEFATLSAEVQAQADAAASDASDAVDIATAATASIAGKMDKPGGGIDSGLVPVAQGDGTTVWSLPDNAFAAVVTYTGAAWPARPASVGAVRYKAFVAPAGTVAFPTDMVSGDNLVVLNSTASTVGTPPAA